MRFGWRPSPDDARDWPIERLGIDPRASIPLEVSFEDLIERIYDQDGPSCVGEAVARAWHLRARIQHASVDYPDALALYALGRAAEVGPVGELEDNGALIRCALQAVNDCGVVRRGTWVDPTRKLRPDWVTIRASADCRTVQYARLRSAAEARSALAAGHPVVIGGQVDRDYERTTSGIWDGPHGEILGGHARCLVGYTPGYLVEVNSWGALDGDAGFRRLSDRAVDWSELWAVEVVSP